MSEKVMIQISSGQGPDECELTDNCLPLPSLDKWHESEQIPHH